MAVRMAGLAFRGRTEHGRDVVLAFDVGLVREIQVTPVRLRFAGERGLEVVVRLGAIETLHRASPSVDRASPPHCVTAIACPPRLHFARRDCDTSN